MSGDGVDIVARAKMLDRLFEEPCSAFSPVGPKQLAALRRLQEQPPQAIRTPLPTLNRSCRDEGGGIGLALGWYALLAGPTGAGKTLLALLFIAEALRQGKNVLLFSLEMSAAQVLARLRAIVSGFEVTHLETGRFFDPKLAEKADEEFAGLPGTLFVNTEPIWRLQDIREVMAVHRETDGVELFVVDYAQLVEPSGADRRLFEAMSSISSQLRFEAHRLHAACIAISQLNRASAGESGPPSVDALYGSSRFGFDADLALILDRRRESNELKRTERRELHVVKNRHGPTITIPLELDKSCLRWREVLPDEQASYSSESARP